MTNGLILILLTTFILNHMKTIMTLRFCNQQQKPYPERRRAQTKELDKVGPNPMWTTCNVVTLAKELNLWDSLSSSEKLGWWRNSHLPKRCDKDWNLITQCPPHSTSSATLSHYYYSYQKKKNNPHLLVVQILN